MTGCRMVTTTRWQTSPWNTFWFKSHSRGKFNKSLYCVARTAPLFWMFGLVIASWTQDVYEQLGFFVCGWQSDEHIDSSSKALSNYLMFWFCTHLFILINVPPTRISFSFPLDLCIWHWNDIMQIQPGWGI